MSLKFQAPSLACLKTHVVFGQLSRKGGASAKPVHAVDTSAPDGGGMRGILFLMVLVLVPGLGLAQDRSSFPRECRIERLAHALAACIDHAADKVMSQMDTRIAMAVSDLQAATGPELRAFEQGLRAVQMRWRDTAERACDGSVRDPNPAKALCRLEAARLREKQLDWSLSDLRARLGADPLYSIPDADAIEVLIPLVLPPGLGGPETSVRVPLTVPIGRD